MWIYSKQRLFSDYMHTSSSGNSYEDNECFNITAQTKMFVEYPCRQYSLISLYHVFCHWIHMLHKQDLCSLTGCFNRLPSTLKSSERLFPWKPMQVLSYLRQCYHGLSWKCLALTIIWWPSCFWELEKTFAKKKSKKLSSQNGKFPFLGATKLAEELEGMSCEERTLGLSTLEKRRLRGDLSALCSLLRRGSGEGGAALFSPGTDDRTCGNSTKLYEERFRLDIRKKFFTVRVVKC